MKLAPYFLFLFILFGCVEKREDKKAAAITAPAPVVLNRFETFFIKFWDSHPGWSKNDIILKETNKAFRKELTAYLKGTDSAFYDYKFELSQMIDYHGKVAGVFRNWGEFPNKRMHTKSFHSDLILIMDRKDAMNLETNKKYRFTGKFVRFIKHQDSEFNMSAWTFDSELNKSGMSNYYGQVNLGAMLFKVKSIQR